MNAVEATEMDIWVCPCKRRASAATGIMIGQATPFTRDKKHPRSAFRTQNHWVRAGTVTHSASATCAAVPSPKQYVYIRKFRYFKFGAGFGL